MLVLFSCGNIAGRTFASIYLIREISLALNITWKGLNRWRMILVIRKAAQAGFEGHLAHLWGSSPKGRMAGTIRQPLISFIFIIWCKYGDLFAFILRPWKDIPLDLSWTINTYIFSAHNTISYLSLVMFVVTTTW